jgi:hypothetical protein
MIEPAGINKDCQKLLAEIKNSATAANNHQEF